MTTPGPASTALRCASQATPAASTFPSLARLGRRRSLRALLADLGIDALHGHALGLANWFRAGVGLEPGDSAIVSLAVEAMGSARIMASVRARRLRLSFHVSTSEQDVDRALDVLRRHVLHSDRALQ